MQNDLTIPDIEEFLKRQLYGHLGCIAPDGRVYVVPITFAYHHNAIYGFTSSGMKVDAMRQHPSVCLQTEEFIRDGVWKSVILWGAFEELLDGERVKGMRILCDRFEAEANIITSPLYQSPASVLVSQGIEKKDAVFYRIQIQEQTGRSVHMDA